MLVRNSGLILFSFFMCILCNKISFITRCSRLNTASFLLSICNAKNKIATFLIVTACRAKSEMVFNVKVLMAFNVKILMAFNVKVFNVKVFH